MIVAPQVRCRVSLDGRYTISVFDNMLPPIRERIRNSPFNLCVACVSEIRNSRGWSFEETIDYFEQQIRCEEV